jgi:hypothetical protein
MDGFRVGNAEQQALGAAVGLARGLGHARYVVEGGFKLGDGKRALVPQPRKSAELAIMRAQRATQKP